MSSQTLFFFVIFVISDNAVKEGVQKNTFIHIYINISIRRIVNCIKLSYHGCILSSITLLYAVLDSCLVRSWAPGFCIHKVRRSRQIDFLLNTLSERERIAFCSHLQPLEMRHQSTHLRHATGPAILLMLQPWAHTTVAEPQTQLALISTYIRKEKIIHLNLIFTENKN